jgi:hypothetical protein
MSEEDRSDPAVRARSALDHERSRDRATRIGAASCLGAIALVAPFVAEPLTGDPGATVGAIVGALLLVALATAVWPHEWTADEERHRWLEAIWREVRTDADAHTPWERYAAWAEPAEGRVELVMICCAPIAERVRGAPSPYTRRVRKRLGPDDVGAAAEAMEELRREAAELEFKAREHYRDDQLEAERREHEEMLRAIDDSATAYEREQEGRVRTELAEQDAAEREAQSEALARALRRP